MAEVIVFEDHPPSRADIAAHLAEHNHTVIEEAASLQGAYDVLGRIIAPDLRNPEDRKLLCASVLVLDGTLSTMASLTGPRPDFSGPYLGPQIDPELMELMPVDTPKLLGRLANRFRKAPPPPPDPTETVFTRNEYSSDAACVAGIITGYQIDLPIVGMSTDQLRIQGVEIAPEYDLTKNRLHELGPLVTAIEQERIARQAGQLKPGVDVAIPADSGSGLRRTKRPEQ